MLVLLIKSFNKLIYLRINVEVEERRQIRSTRSTISASTV